MTNSIFDRKRLNEKKMRVNIAKTIARWGYVTATANVRQHFKLNDKVNG